MYSTAMQVLDVLKLIWGKVENPRSMCPDVEIGYVRRVLGEVMAAEVGERGIAAEGVDRWVLGQLLVGPMGEEGLAEDWYTTNRVYLERIQPPNDNYEDKGYCEAIEAQFAAEDRERGQRGVEVAEALRRLIETCLVGSTLEGGYSPRYFGDLAVYRKTIKGGCGA